MNEGAERRLRLLGRWSQASCAWGEVLFLRSNSKNISRQSDSCLKLEICRVTLLNFYQVAMPRIECKEQEQADICLRPGCRFLFILVFLFHCFFYVCRLVSNNTDCLTTDIPTEVCLSLYWIAFVSRYFWLVTWFKTFAGAPRGPGVRGVQAWQDQAETWTCSGLSTMLGVILYWLLMVIVVRRATVWASIFSGRDLRRLNVPRVLHGRGGDTK